jgi:general secretion pathway protein D
MKENDGRNCVYRSKGAVRGSMAAICLLLAHDGAYAGQLEYVDSITLSDATVQQTLETVGKLEDRTVIIPNNLPSNVRINLNIPMRITKEEAIVGLKSVLSANGVAVSPMGEKYLKASPINRAKNDAPPLLEGQSIGNLVPSQEVCSRIFPLSNLTAREASRIVYSLLTPGSSAVVALDKANSVLITDTLSNLQHIEMLFGKIDRVGEVSEEVTFFTLKNVSASDAKTRMDSLQNGVLKRYFYGTTSFEADDRTNQLIAIAPPGNSPLINQLVGGLDVSVTPLTQTRVINVKHGSSKDLTDLAKKIVQQQNESTDRNVAITGPQPNPAGGESAARFSKNLSIEADERSNSVVVYGTPTDIQQITDLVNKLDVVLPQVRIEVIIAEVRLKKGEVSGLETFGYRVNDRTTNATYTPSLGSSGISGGNVRASKIFGSAKIGDSTINLGLKPFSLENVLGMAKQNDNVTVLSSPVLITSHNREASIKVAESRPYISHSVSKVGDRANDPATTSNEIKQEEAGIELTVKPLIGLNGVVQMEITQVIDDFSTSSVTAPGTSMQLPYIVKRKIQSFVAVNSGEVVALGGLKQRNFKDTKKKMLLLGSIPLFGEKLFTNKDKEEEVKELIVFIRPQALTNLEEATDNSRAMMEKLTETNRTNVQDYIDNNTLDLSKEENEKDKLKERRAKKEEKKLQAKEEKRGKRLQVAEEKRLKIEERKNADRQKREEERIVRAQKRRNAELKTKKAREARETGRRRSSKR